MSVRKLHQIVINLNEESPDNEFHPEVEILLSRLKGITPTEMASALCFLELHENFKKKHSPALVRPMFGEGEDLSQVLFSRGLKSEIQVIYAELAKHLRLKNQGAGKLMNEVFDFFSKTVRSLVGVPHLVSKN
jgi:hypothetical protein